MLKHIATLITGRRRRAPTGQNAPAFLKTEGAYITAYDAQGREIYIDRATWLQDVLLPNLRRQWDDAGALADLVIGGVDDGFGEHLLEASKRLLELDRHRKPERGYLLRGIVLRENGRLGEAQAVLEDGIRLTGRRAALLVNLARVHAERGDAGRADALLREGLQGDPNLEAGLACWLAVARERGGDEAVHDALRQAADLPRSWLPQLWLAREHLQAGRLEPALVLYRWVLAAGDHAPSALETIAHDLLRHRHAAPLPRLLGALYEPTRHDPQVGLDLLEAYLQLQRLHEGEALLQRLGRLRLAAIQERLDDYAQAFGALRARAEADAEQRDEAPSVL